MLTLLVAASIFASPAYYPEGARRRGEQGVTKVRLDVDPAGRPKMCRVVESSGSAELDASACELIHAQMHYTPGYDPRGAALPSVHFQSVRWQLKADPEEERQGQPVRVLLASVLAAFLIYLPMSIIHAFQAGDFWRFEKAGRFSMLRAASRAQHPRLYWAAMTARVAAFLLLSVAMTEVVALMSPANVRVSTAAASR